MHYIYAIREINTRGIYKVGRSKHPVVRRTELNTGNPRELEIAIILGQYGNKRGSKYIMVLDVETANDMVDPLVYDVGYIIADLHGNIFEQKSVCIHEIFNLRKDLMETAYYANKIPSYYKELWAKRTESIYIFMKCVKRCLTLCESIK